MTNTIRDATRLFKPWIVRRPDGGCQVLFPLSELDNLIDGTLKILDRFYCYKGTCSIVTKKVNCDKSSHEI